MNYNLKNVFLYSNTIKIRFAKFAATNSKGRTISIVEVILGKTHTKALQNTVRSSSFSTTGEDLEKKAKNKKGEERMKLHKYI